MSKPKIAMLCVVLLCALGVWWVSYGQRSLPALTYSRFLEEVRTGQVASVIVFGSNSGAIDANCQLKDGSTVRTVLPSDYKDALEAMQDKLVNIEIRNSFGPPRVLWNAAPFLVLLACWILLIMGKFPNGIIGGTASGRPPLR